MLMYSTKSHIFGVLVVSSLSVVEKMFVGQHEWSEDYYFHVCFIFEAALEFQSKGFILKC